MKKDIYDMINESDINLDEYEVCELNDMEKIKMKKAFRKMNTGKKNKFSKLAKVSAFGVLFGGAFLMSPFGEPVMAGIEVVTYQIGELMGIDKNLDDYKTVVGKTVSDNGITVKLNEAILDGNMLKVIYTSHIETEENLDMIFFERENIYINGKSNTSGSSGGAGKVEDNTFVYELDYLIQDMDSIDLTKDIDVKIKLKDVRTTNEKTNRGKVIKGDWEFEFAVNPSEIIAKTETIDINKKIDVDGIGEIEIQKYTSNDLGQKIYIKSSESLNGEYSEKIVGTDNLGNKVEFDLRYQNESGGMLELYDLEGGLSEDATELTLRLELAKYPEESGEMNSEYKVYGDEFTIKIK